jgi:hypothetical protein
MNNNTNTTPAQISRNPKDRGQAIVLVAFLMVALLAAAGMAVDGGGLYFLYRDAQNATDAAALAAAYTLCTNPDSDWQGTAELSLANSGFMDATDGTAATNVRLVSNGELLELSGEEACPCEDDGTEDDEAEEGSSPEAGPTDPVLIRGYYVDFVSRTYAGGQTTFTYEVTGTGTPPDLSHFTLELPSCVEVVSYSPSNSVEFGVDPTTGVDGIKWDFGLGMNESRTYSVTFAGNVPLGSVLAAVKGGPGYEAKQVAGPGCGTPPEEPEDEECPCSVESNYTYAVEVSVEAEKPSYFIHVVYPEDLVVDVSTIAYCNAGSPVDESGEVEERTAYAFHLRSPRGTCSSYKYALRLNGAGNDIYGDIYVDDNIWGNNYNAFDIFGDIYIGAPESDPPNDNLEYLHEETTSGPLYDGHGDGEITFNAPSAASTGYNPFPWSDWSELLPGGSVQATLGSNYHILPCSAGGKVEPGTWSDFYTSPGSGVLRDGFYVPDYEGTEGYACNANQQLQLNGLRGRVTIISNGKIETTGAGQLTPYWENVLLASNLGRSDPQTCGDGDHSIRLSGSGETLQGDIIVNNNGMIWADGVNSTYESCFSAWAVNISGNNSNYFCQPGGAPPENSSPTIGILD